MELQNEIKEEIQNPNKRPQILTVLTILTFVYTGISFVSSLFSLLKGPMTEDQMIEQKVQMLKSIKPMKEQGMDYVVQLLEQVDNMTASINANFYAVSLIALLVIVLGFFAALLVWKGRKLGFHLYIIYSLLSIIQLYFFVDAQYIPSIVVIINMIISGVFVLLYSKGLKWLN